MMGPEPEHNIHTQNLLSKFLMMPSLFSLLKQNTMADHLTIWVVNSITVSALQDLLSRQERTTAKLMKPWFNCNKIYSMAYEPCMQYIVRFRR